MTIILQSGTPIVRKLVEKVAQRRGDVLLDDEAEHADLIIIDDSERASWSCERAREVASESIYLGSRLDETPEGFDRVLAKPFLPEELMETLEQCEAKEMTDTTIFADEVGEDESAYHDVTTEAEEQESVLNEGDVDELKGILDAFEHDVSEAGITQAHKTTFEEEEGETPVVDFEEEFESGTLENSFRDDKVFDEMPYDEAPESEAETLAFDEEAVAFKEADFTDEDTFSYEVPEEESVEMADSEAVPYTDEKTDASYAFTASEALDDHLSGEALHSRGVEALQDVMAILSDESVARALKEMGVRVDISFGERR